MPGGGRRKKPRAAATAAAAAATPAKGIETPTVPQSSLPVPVETWSAPHRQRQSPFSVIVSRTVEVVGVDEQKGELITTASDDGGQEQKLLLPPERWVDHN